MSVREPPWFTVEVMRKSPFKFRHALLLLVAILAVNARNLAVWVFDDIRESRGREDLRELSKRIESYRNNRGSYPDSLVAIIKLVPSDPWGNKYRYRLLDDGGKHPFEVLSAGPDGIHGNEDNLSSID